jgi:hypothetical protein
MYRNVFIRGKLKGIFQVYAYDPFKAWVTERMIHCLNEWMDGWMNEWMNEW